MRIGSSISIGILGAARIVPRSMLAPAGWLEEPCGFAVAARERARAQRFAAAHGIHRVFDDYDALLAGDAIDAVYIPLPNALHVQWATKALQAGKPTLVEKPVCLSRDALDELAEVGRVCAVPLLEAAMVRHHPWQAALRELIQGQRLGRLLAVKTNLGMDIREAPADDFRFSPRMGGGAWLDLGPYWVQFLQACIGLDLEDIDVRAAIDPDKGVDMSCEIRAHLADGVAVECACSFTQAFQASHTLELEKGRLIVRNFFRPAFGRQVLWIDLEDDETNTREKIKFPAQNYYANQLERFIEVIRGVASPEPLAAMRERVALLEAVHLSVMS